MNRRQARELAGALAARFPDGEITVTAQDGGAQVVIELPGDENHRFSVGDGPSVLLSHLLTGRAD
jgi:hypothetical protein